MVPVQFVLSYGDQSLDEENLSLTHSIKLKLDSSLAEKNK
jgi:hypothetical protein